MTRHPSHLSIVTWLVGTALSFPVAGTALTDALPRRAAFQAESYPGIRVEYGELLTDDAVRLRTIVTRPAAGPARLPAILYVQWLSCDSVELSPTANDGWSLMLKRLITESGALIWRTEKAGVGDSGGPACAVLDYETELAHHRAALEQLKRRSDIDPERIVVFGASMGTTMAPLIAQGQRLRGVATWGGGARSWLERQIAFDRRALELSGRPASGLGEEMRRRIEFQTLYLAGRQTPEAIARHRPDLADIATRIVGLEGATHYGRPLGFHWQAQAQDWAGAWARIEAPVLALLGEYDWFEEPRSAELIARIVSKGSSGRGEFRLIAGIDHNFTRFPSAEAAFAGSGGTADPGAVLDVLLPWLRERLR